MNYISTHTYDDQEIKWFTPDPAEQFSNPYLAMGNNPVMYVDPDGEFVFTVLAAVFAPPLLPWAIGADIGMWSGGTMANGTANPFQWDYSSGRTWGYMAGGAITGAFSGGAANAVATSGIAFANTAAIATGSIISSTGTYLYTGGQSDFTISLGVASYNFSAGEWNHLGKKGNSFMQNLGYTLGGVANLTDVKNFATWDVLSKQGKVEKLQELYGDTKIAYDKNTSKTAYFDANADIIYFGRKGLRNGMGWAKSTYEHEALHRADFLNQPDIPSHIFSQEQYQHFLESRAYRLELDRSAHNALSYRQHKFLGYKYHRYSRLAGVPTNSIPNFTTWQWLRGFYLP